MPDDNPCNHICRCCLLTQTLLVCLGLWPASALLSGQRTGKGGIPFIWSYPLWRGPWNMAALRAWLHLVQYNLWDLLQSVTFHWGEQSMIANQFWRPCFESSQIRFWFRFFLTTCTTITCSLAFWRICGQIAIALLVMVADAVRRPGVLGGYCSPILGEFWHSFLQSMSLACVSANVQVRNAYLPPWYKSRRMFGSVSLHGRLRMQRKCLMFQWPHWCNV